RHRLPARPERHQAQRKRERPAGGRRLIVAGNPGDRSCLRTTRSTAVATTRGPDQCGEGDGDEPTKRCHGASLLGHDAVEYLAVSDHAELLPRHALLDRGVRLEI